MNTTPNKLGSSLQKFLLENFIPLGVGAAYGSIGENSKDLFKRKTETAWYYKWLLDSWLILLFVLITALFGCTNQSDTALDEGYWRGVFLLEEKEIPFNFTVEYGDGDNPLVTLTNAEERFELDRSFWKGDSLVIPIEIFDTQFIGKVSGGSYTGFFRRNGGAGNGIAFSAIPHQENRFETFQNGEPVSHVDGKWSLVSYREAGEENRLVGVFEQEGNRVSGSILTTTGDYRYLQGVVDGDSLKLSSFSGSSPILFEAKILNSDVLEGTLSGVGGSSRIEGKKDGNASLPDPYSLTFLKGGI